MPLFSFPDGLFNLLFFSASSGQNGRLRAQRQTLGPARPAAASSSSSSLASPSSHVGRASRLGAPPPQRAATRKHFIKEGEEEDPAKKVR